MHSKYRNIKRQHDYNSKTGSEKTMSMRATFTTSFIYDGGPGFEDRKYTMCEILSIPIENRCHSMIGQLSGIVSGSDLEEDDIRMWIDEQCRDLRKITTIPFKIVYLLEGGDILIRDIQPYEKHRI